MNDNFDPITTKPVNDDDLVRSVGYNKSRFYYVKEYNRWLRGNVVPRMIKKLGIDIQDWYDSVILPILTNGSKYRPKCPYCGKDCLWTGIYKGYIKTCGDHDCRCRYNSECSKESYRTHPTRLKDRVKEMTERFKNEEYKKNHRMKRIKSWRNPSEKMKLSNKKKGKLGERSGVSSYMYSMYEDKMIHFDSNWERWFFINMSNSPDVISILRSPVSIGYTNPNDNEMHYYIPDFLIEYSNGYKEIIEIKPSHLISDPVNKSKIESGISYGFLHGIGYRVITDNNYKFRL